MALTRPPQEVPARPDELTQPNDEAPIHTRFSAAPCPQVRISEPRYIHAMMFAAWLGRLIDPVDLAHHPGMGLWNTGVWNTKHTK
jgi:hypothetical protein